MADDSITHAYARHLLDSIRVASSKASSLNDIKVESDAYRGAWASCLSARGKAPCYAQQVVESFPTLAALLRKLDSLSRSTVQEHRDFDAQGILANARVCFRVVAKLFAGEGVPVDETLVSALGLYSFVFVCRDCAMVAPVVCVRSSHFFASQTSLLTSLRRLQLPRRRPSCSTTRRAAPATSAHVVLRTRARRVNRRARRRKVVSDASVSARNRALLSKPTNLQQSPSEAKI